MNNPLKVLIAEDDPADADLVMLELKRLGYDPTWTRTESDYDTRDALTRESWDLIISDFTISKYVGFSAFHVLAAVQDLKIDTPVLLVTGALSEQEAIEVAGLGCHGYVLKDKLRIGLGFHVKNCLYIASQHRAVKREARRHLKIVDNPLVGVMLINHDGIIQWQNVASLPILGWKPEEVVGQNVFDFLHPSDAEQGQVLWKRFLSKPGDVVKWYFRIKCNFVVQGDAWRKCLVAGHNLLEDEDVRALVGYFSPTEN